MSFSDVAGESAEQDQTTRTVQADLALRYPQNKSFVAKDRRRVAILRNLETSF